MKKIIIRIIVALAVHAIALLSPAIAQDPVYSQPYLSPINLNPAATGAGDYDLSVSAIYQAALVDHAFTNELYGFFY